MNPSVDTSRGRPPATLAPSPEASVVPADLVEYSKLTPEQRVAAVQAFEAAVEAFVADAGAGADDAQLARRLVALHAHRLALGPDGAPVLLLEFPVLTAHPTQLDERARRELGPHGHDGLAGWRGCGNYEEYFDVLYTDGRFRAVDLREAVALLVRDDNPEAALASRRAEVAARRKAVADAALAAEQTERARQAEEARWLRDNAPRLEAWNRLPRDAQALHVVADRFPEHRAMLEALAELQTPLGTSTRLPGLGMPATFRPELARGGGR
jgi:hypothetical protein